MLNIHVFLGPTLPVSAAKAILPEARVLPPAAMGDVYSLVESGDAGVIAVVDGLFDLTPAVWHKEILYAISKGARVLGASSMGALRAAELCAFGMEGHGRIFEAYRDGELEDDDEVAIVHAPREDGYRALSDAMVNLRHGLARAAELGLIGPKAREALTREAKAMFYPERSWQALFARAGGLGIAGAEVRGLRDFVRRERPDLKRDDAVGLLRRLAEEVDRAADAPRAAAPGFEFEQTTFFRKMAQEQQTRRTPGRETPLVPGRAEQ